MASLLERLALNYCEYIPMRYILSKTCKISPERRFPQSPAPSGLRLGIFAIYQVCPSTFARCAAFVQARPLSMKATKATRILREDKESGLIGSKFYADV